VRCPLTSFARFLQARDPISASRRAGQRGCSTPGRPNGDCPRRTTMPFGRSRLRRPLLWAGSETTKGQEMALASLATLSGHSSGTVGGLGNTPTTQKCPSRVARPAVN
jgi:hypothetical protein